MKGLAKTLAGTFLMAACILAFGINTFAATGMYVGKDVSAEGTTLVGVSVEGQLGVASVPVILEKGLIKEGDAIEADNGFAYTLPEDSAKITLVRLMSYVGYGDWNILATNEYGVSVVAFVTTEANIDAQTADPFVEDGVCEQKLATILTANSKSAKDAVTLLCSLIEEKGVDAAEIVFIADKDGAWVVENFTGHQYVATKLPDDAIATFSNEPVIKTADPDDENTVCSSELFTLPEENGFAVYADDGTLDLILTYNDGNMYSDEAHLRGWVGHDIFAPSEELDYDAEEGYDVFFAPDEKVSIEQAFEFFRNRYEGTAFDLSDDDNDYYWGINNQAVGNVALVQVFDDVPEAMSTVIWNTPSNPTASPFLPLPALADEIPEIYSTDSDEASFEDGIVQFDFAKLNTKVVPRRNLYGASIRQYWEGMEAFSADDVADLIRGEWKEAYDASAEDAVSTVDDFVDSIVTDADENCNRLAGELDWYLFTNGIRKGSVDDDELPAFECSFDAVSYANINGWETTLDGDVFTATKDGKTIEVIIGGENEGNVTFTGFDDEELAEIFDEEGEPDENGETEEAAADEEIVEEEIAEIEDTAEEPEEEPAEEPADADATEEVVKAAAAQIEVDTIAELEEYFGEKIAAIPRDGWAENEIARQLNDVSNDIAVIIGRHFNGDIDLDRLMTEDYYKLGNDIAGDPDLAKAGDKLIVAGMDLSALFENYFASLYDDVSADLVSGRLTQEGAQKILSEAETDVEGIAQLYIEGLAGAFGEVFNTDLSDEELAEILAELGDGTIQLMEDYGVIDRSSLGLPEGTDLADLTDAEINVVITLSEMDDDVLDGLSALLGVDVRATIDMYMDAINASTPNLTIVEENHENETAQSAPDEEVMAAIELEEALTEDDVIIPQEVIDILNEAIAEAQNGQQDEETAGTADTVADNAPESAPAAADAGQISVSLGKITTTNGTVMLPTYMLRYFN